MLATLEREIQVHYLSTKPEECYNELEKEQKRFKSLRSVKCQGDLLNLKENRDGSIRFVCISDTHSKTDRLLSALPEGDVLIHTGDFTALSAESEILQFNEFLGAVKSKFQYLLVIAGNHEITFDDRTWNKGGLLMSLVKLYNFRSPFSQQLTPVKSKNLLTNCTYIQDETIELFGIKIYGSPWQPAHFDLAFNLPRGQRLLDTWNKIPDDTDILITHGPPMGIGDRAKGRFHVGCAELLSTVQDRVKPRYHIFGHIHEDHGIWSDGCTTFINASICDRKYNPVHNAIVFDYQV